ncbi:phage integrase N-terminal SAM-like domain-containing protein [Pseudoalteromonas citrea]|uniref:phage integrase N-terminal SAM-like domain-containing protein n=2 Tax=Pseudoalteromonas citrea TaxID=43655 RepID=UPI0020161CA1|nr:phage integrase N-terminal SAM-like domain-containing protein [Pseudoalteromonas citrea]
MEKGINIGWLHSPQSFLNGCHCSLLFVDNNEVVEYLDYLVLKCNVSPKTQATALNALSFLYKKIIKQDLCPNLTFVRSKRQSKLPIVMTP